MLLSAPATAPAQAASASLPPIRHVFVIVLENKEFAEWFALGRTFDPYMSQTLPSEGVLIPNYFGIGHSSADNYIGMISGQPPTADSKNDCQDPMKEQPGTQDGNGVAQGNGCIYPPQFKTVGDQMTAARLTWKAYAESIPSPCYPGISAPGSYERKHDAFPYFLSGVQDGNCAANNVNLNQLPAALQSASTTANLNFIFPNECDDGHSDCTGSTPLAPIPVVGSEADEMAQFDAFLKKWVPLITSAPAFKRHGLLLITFDEGYDPLGCCGEPMQDPDGSFPGGEAGSPGNGGGQVGAIAISPLIKPGTVSTGQYNHYSLLASVEDLFRLPRLGEARLPGTTTFGSDVYSGWSGRAARRRSSG